MLNNNIKKMSSNCEIEINNIYYKHLAAVVTPEQAEIELTFETGEQRSLLLPVKSLNCKELRKLEPKLTVKDYSVFDNYLQQKLQDARNDEGKCGFYFDQPGLHKLPDVRLSMFGATKS